MKMMLDLPEIFLPKKINYGDKILLIGSCFSEEMGNKMKELKFSVLQNPNGILYDPLSITKSINSYIENINYKDDDLFYKDELWHSWQHHSLFSGIDKEDVLNRINQSQNKAHEFITSASWLIITFGSSFYYQLQQGEEVANCHKLPSSNFNKKLLSSEENIAATSSIIQKLRSINPAIKIILTVSPVRHIKDGIAENNRSKARLAEAAHTLTEKFEDVFYFPAYEIVIDILRDYRFYKKDLVHPSDAAIGNVFEVFKNSVIEQQDLVILEEIKKLIDAKNHKVFHAATAAYSQFKKVNLIKATSLQSKHPYIDLSEEIKYFAD
jgi:hypothetical protein